MTALARPFPRMVVLAGSAAAPEDRDAVRRAIAADWIPDVVYAEESWGAITTDTAGHSDLLHDGIN